jgi:hypothetical protein
LSGGGRKALIRNALWVATAVVGIALYFQPIAAVAFLPLLVAAGLLSLRRVRPRRGYGEHGGDYSETHGRFNSDPNVGLAKYDRRGERDWHWRFPVWAPSRGKTRTGRAPCEATSRATGSDHAAVV